MGLEEVKRDTTNIDKHIKKRIIEINNSIKKYGIGASVIEAHGELVHRKLETPGLKRKSA